MLQTNDNWCINIDRGLLNGVIFIDLKKAFDTNDHEIILKKLTKYGDDQDALKTKEIASFKNPTCLFLRSFQGTAASFAIQIGVFSITLEPLLPSPCAAFSQLFNSRSIHFGDVSRDERAGDALAISLGPRDPKRIGRLEKTWQEPLHNAHLGDRRK